MTAHDTTLQWGAQALPPHSSAASGLIRPLMWMGMSTIAATAAAFVLFERLGPQLFPAIHATGMVGLTTGSLSLAALGIISSLYIVLARQQARACLPQQTGTPRPRFSHSWFWTTNTLFFCCFAGYAVLADWPLRRITEEVPASPNGFMMASGILLLAVPWLLMERYLRTVSTEQLPEIDDLRALVFLPVLSLVAEAVLQLVTGLGFGMPRWAHAVLAAIVLLICLELCARAIAVWFQPPRDSMTTRAPISSLLARALHGNSWPAGGMAAVVRSQFGIDFSRSWALHFVRSAAIPVALLMLAFCWLLTGITRVDLNERGSYERFGVPVAMLRPGLHLTLPWPFGIVRHVELGVVHAMPVSYGEQGTVPQLVDQSSAEGDAPASANRLWDSEQPSDISYIIASAGQNQQSFQTVSVSASVLFRIGMTDADARGALYGEADPGALVHSLASRLLAQYFATQTLPSVLGESQVTIASNVQTQLQNALDQLGSGIDVVAFVIEALHPPSGAASAYRSVQAAQIAASTSISSEQGRARSTESVARLDAHNAANDAMSVAAETVSAAEIDRINMAADDHPFRAASKPFLLERYFNNLTAALANVSLEIVDHRLTGVSRPTIDLRPVGALRDAVPVRPARGEATP
jgi:regulator of protease activity HflC (stomatin/prohibitin superfamily)